MLPALLCQKADAQGRVVEFGKSILADVFGAANGPEALGVVWSVGESDSGLYTYSYTVINPLGDVLLTDQGQPTSTPEIVDSFSVGFDTTAPGAYVPSSQTGGTVDLDLGTAGLFWYFPPVPPGGRSPLLSFESHAPPTLGNADASDANPPSPWSSSPSGQPVGVPGDPQTDVPEPTTVALFVATGLLLLALRFKFWKKAGSPQQGWRSR
jgi:hypothetical protein